MLVAALDVIIAMKMVTFTMRHVVCGTLKSTKYLLPLGYFLMVICGSGPGAGDNVELVPIDPLYPVPECLSQLNPSPAPLDAMAGALDYSRKSDMT